MDSEVGRDGKGGLKTIGHWSSPKSGLHENKFGGAAPRPHYCLSSFVPEECDRRHSFERPGSVKRIVRPFVEPADLARRPLSVFVSAQLKPDAGSAASGKLAAPSDEAQTAAAE
jgi:hypothetical protein